MSDFQGKYQKLATEYAKLRAQVPVLKKAVIDEQAKKKELEDLIKDRDTSVRKYEQEVESLAFRNQQLASRVEVLQGELENASSGSKSKKSKTKGSAPPQLTSSVSVFDEELQSKIEENAMLHKKVYETDEEHRSTINKLRERLVVLEAEASSHQEVLDSTTQHNKEHIDKLHQDKAMLEIRLQKQEKEVKEAKSRADSAEQKLKSIEEDLTTRLNEATKTIRDKLPFNDTEFRELNALNIPTHDRQHQLQTQELVGQAGTLVRELVQGLSNFHTYCEQRSSTYPADKQRETLSTVNKKFCQCLHENAVYLRPVEQSFRNFQENLKEDALTTLETSVGLQDFSEKFRKYTAYASRILPYHLLSLEEECSVSLCSQTLEAKNMEVHRCLQLFTNALSNVDTYVSLLAGQSQADCDHPRSSHSQMFALLSKSVTRLHEATKELSKYFNAKVSLEHQLPTATQKLKTTDECVVSSLIGLVTCTSKLSAFLSGNLEFFCQTAGYKTRGSSVSTSESLDGPKSHPAVANFRQKAADYISSISRSNTDSVPYKLAIQNRKTLFSSTESRESLAQQVLTFQEKLGKLEQEKEHWMLESQLLQMKYEKEQQKVGELDNQIKKLDASINGSIEDNIDVSTQLNKRTKSNSSAQHIDTSMLGQLHVTEGGQKDGDTREQLIKSHFSQRIGELTNQLQMADSKAVHYYAECRALHKRLDIAEKQKQKALADLATATQNNAQLKDELQTTTRSYEGQLSMMSEHLAGMNEKLTTQKEEIDVLKYQLSNKNLKKGKLK